MEIGQNNDSVNDVIAKPQPSILVPTKEEKKSFDQNIILTNGLETNSQTSIESESIEDMMSNLFSCTLCHRRFSEIQELEDHVSHHTENELPSLDEHLQSIEEDSKKDNTKEMEIE